MLIRGHQQPSISWMNHGKCMLAYLWIMVAVHKIWISIIWITCLSSRSRLVLRLFSHCSTSEIPMWAPEETNSNTQSSVPSNTFHHNYRICNRISSQLSNLRTKKKKTALAAASTREIKNRPTNKLKKLCRVNLNLLWRNNQISASLVIANLKKEGVENVREMTCISSRPSKESKI